MHSAGYSYDSEDTFPDPDENPYAWKNVKHKEPLWIKERRENYYKRLEDSARHPPDEDEWNK